MVLFCIGCLDVECPCGMLVLCDTTVPLGIQGMVSLRGIQCLVPSSFRLGNTVVVAAKRNIDVCYYDSAGISLLERCVVSIADRRSYGLLY